jgi:hypothetical protein
MLVTIMHNRFMQKQSPLMNPYFEMLHKGLQVLCEIFFEIFKLLSTPKKKLTLPLKTGTI